MDAATIEQQFVVLLFLGAAGVAVGAVFDFSKAGGAVFHISRRMLFFADLFTCLVAALAIFQLLFLTNWGEVRLYVFLALSLGLILYYAFLSRHLYRSFLSFFQGIMYIILKILKTRMFMQDYLNKQRIHYKRFINRLKEFSKRENRHDR
ncbi:MAG: hypothetical protein GX996_01690 [Firmicutes bacterium]|nr:hypothetical protein [Bacillota bacterium]